MSKVADHNIIVGLDVGTATISALVGELLPDGQINIIGSGSAISRGMSKGGVNDLEAVVKSIQRAVDQAELMAECQISQVFLSISGMHIASRIEKGMGAISDEDVTQEDMDHAIHTAKSIKMSDEQRILHIIPQEFTIDYQGGIKNPLGLSGVRMEVSVHLISCHNDMAKNIIKAVERCGLTVLQLVFSGLASSNAVITDDERELGVCVVDIGAGTMDVAIWTDGALRQTRVFAYAGNAVTSDVAIAFKTPMSDAEEIKVKYGCALSSLTREDETINVPSVGGRPSRSLQRKMLAGVIESRYSELLEFVNQEIDEVQTILRENDIKEHLAAGIVLTGGASQIEGLVECAERVFGKQVRIGKPLDVSGLTDYVKAPYHSTAVGLLHYAKNSQAHDEDSEYNEPKRLTPSLLSTLLSKMSQFRHWIQKEF